MWPTQPRTVQGEQKERFNAIQQELSQLSTKFSNNVLDSTKSFKKLVTDAGDLEGVPPSAMSLYAQQAKGEGHEEATAEKGPWLLTLVRFSREGAHGTTIDRVSLVDHFHAETTVLWVGRT